MTGAGRTDAPGSRRRQPIWAAWTAALALLLVAVVVGVLVGPMGIGVDSVLRELASRIPGLGDLAVLDERRAAIVTEIRLPRVLLTLIVGAVLATAGGAYQGVFHNDLADPYLLGVAGGAGLGVTLALTAFDASGNVVPIAALVGALAAAGATYLLADTGVTGAGVATSRATLILTGVVVAALAGALQTFVLQRHHEAIRDVYAWLLGRFNTATWADVRLIAPYALVAIAGLVALGGRIDVMGVGDVEAAALGVDPRRTRLLAIALASLGTAAAVAVSGLIGFVGVIVPHGVRLVAGPRYRRVLPLSVLAGAAFMCLADVAARSVLSPAEIPVGVVTALVGAPAFLVAMRYTRRSPHRTVGV